MKMSLKQASNQDLLRKRFTAYEALKDTPALSELEYKPTRKYVESTKEVP